LEPALVTSVVPLAFVTGTGLGTPESMAADDDIDAAHSRDEFKVHVHAIMQQQYHHGSALAARFINVFLQALFLNAKSPFGHQVTRIGDGRIEDCLSDHCHRNATKLAHGPGLEYRVAEIRHLDVLGEELSPLGQFLIDNLLHAVLAAGELPVRSHDFQAQQARRLDHVLPAAQLLTRSGHLVEEEGMRCLANIDPDNPLRPLHAASCNYRIALGPRPRLHLIRFHGVLAPNAGLRAVIAPGLAHKPGEHAEEHAKEHAHASARMGWARLLRRVFDLDLEHCPQCGGNLRIIAAIGAPAVIVRMLTHLGLPERASPRTPARPLSLFHAA
jgi:hypothetical protein